jgi:hypothetical protein
MRVLEAQDSGEGLRAHAGRSRHTSRRTPARLAPDVHRSRWPCAPPLSSVYEPTSPAHRRLRLVTRLPALHYAAYVSHGRSSYENRAGSERGGISSGSPGVKVEGQQYISQLGESTGQLFAPPARPHPRAADAGQHAASPRNGRGPPGARTGRAKGKAATSLAEAAGKGASAGHQWLCRAVSSFSFPHTQRSSAYTVGMRYRGPATPVAEPRTPSG